MATDRHSILKVPPGMLLPVIKSENLRTSALMDQNARQPFTQRHLHVVGKRAYELVVSVHLVTAYPGISNEKMAGLHDQLTALSEVVCLSNQFELHKHLHLYGAELGEKTMSDAFYAWMGAVLVESGIVPICKFISALLEINDQKIQCLETGPENGPPQRQGLALVGGQTGNMIQGKENGGVVGMEIIPGADSVEKTPSGHKLSYSNSKGSLVSEPEEAPLLAGTDTMKRRKLAPPRAAPPPIFE
ncbi:uncharacterized protein DFL_003484 [Arthrobotrys flagrans]|uniref:RNase III domain-containing protein n=1 Tax=Arthrobotrys flagrans TaxID=97331 RepID=A0A437A1Y3_ARTFL|nr:hypothetical protein DFL_003484 [Arthrobotrys flagrans]